jgi:hypothetical protein
MPGDGNSGSQGTETQVGKFGWIYGEKRIWRIADAPVPQTDTGGWGEEPKASGRRVVKELGKLTP